MHIEWRGYTAVKWFTITKTIIKGEVKPRAIDKFKSQCLSESNYVVNGI